MCTGTSGYREQDHDHMLPQCDISPSLFLCIKKMVMCVVSIATVLVPSYRNKLSIYIPFHPSCIYNHRPSISCCIMHKIMYITCALFILKLSVVVRSVLYILHPPD